MDILNLQQGTPEWIEARTKYLCASEAAAMLGFDPNMSRNELLRIKATGDARAISEWQEKVLFARGHEIEKIVRDRLIAETGDILFQATGVSGVLLASFDGLADDQTWALEAKQWNDALAAYLREKADLPDSHWPQCESQIAVGKLSYVVFKVSDGQDREETLVYHSKPERRKMLLDGWRLFREDVKNYKPVEYIPADPVGESQVKQLPVLTVTVEGKLIASNFEEFKAAYLAQIEGIRTEGLETDQDFSDAEATAKKIESARDELKARARLVRGQIVPIDSILTGLEDFDKALQQKHSRLMEQINSRKQGRKAAIVQSGHDRLAEHVAGLNKRWPQPLMPEIRADFASAVRNKRSFKNMQDDVDALLTQEKVKAHAVADRIGENLKLLEKDGYTQYKHLFHDLRAIVGKPPDDFSAIVHDRIRQHNETQERVRLEAERKAQEAQAAREAQEAAKRRAEDERQAKAVERARSGLERHAVLPNGDRVDKSTGEVVSKQALPPDLTKAAPSVAAAIVAQAPAKPTRPTDDLIITVLTDHFRVHESKVIEWLLGMDLEAASQRMVAAEFQP